MMIDYSSWKRQFSFLGNFALAISLFSSSCALHPSLVEDEPDEDRDFAGELVASNLSSSAAENTSKQKRKAKIQVQGVGLRQANSMGGGAAPIPQGKKFRVFILMGQSNMTGYGRSGDLPKSMSQPRDQIRIWANGRWEYLVPRRNFGPETAFAHRLADSRPNDVIGIIKVAVPATALAAWNPEYDPKLAAASGDALKGSLYRDMVRTVNAARKISDFELAGMIWKQGGKDGRSRRLAESYQDRFVKMVKSMRSDLGAPYMPVFVLTYYNEEGLAENEDRINKLRRNALPVFQSQASVSDYLENAYPIFHGELPTRLDRVHFNSDGQIKLGKMAADTVMAIMNKEEIAKKEEQTEADTLQSATEPQSPPARAADQ